MTISTSQKTKAFFWIAAGDTYVREAAKSAATVADLHPNMDRFLITPDVHRGVPNVFNFYCQAPERRGPFWYLDSTRYFAFALKSLERYSFLMYLDTDTRVIEPLDDVFTLLMKFDLVGCHAPGRVTRASKDPVPLSFPELNIGTLGFFNNKKTRRFTLDWLNRYEADATFYGNNDQASLRETLWENAAGIKFYVMPTEYNFRFGFGGWARYPIHVLHGRTQNWPALIEKVNRDKKGFRGWDPGEL